LNYKINTVEQYLSSVDHDMNTLSQEEAVVPEIFRCGRIKKKSGIIQQVDLWIKYNAK